MQNTMVHYKIGNFICMLLNNLFNFLKFRIFLNLFLYNDQINQCWCWNMVAMWTIGGSRDRASTVLLSNPGFYTTSKEYPKSLAIHLWYCDCMIHCSSKIFKDLWSVFTKNFLPNKYKASSLDNKDKNY